MKKKNFDGIKFIKNMFIFDAVLLVIVTMLIVSGHVRNNETSKKLDAILSKVASLEARNTQIENGLGNLINNETIQNQVIVDIYNIVKR